MTIINDAILQEKTNSGSLKSSGPISNLQHIKNAGWPLNPIIPLLPWNATEFPPKSRGKAPAVPKTPGQPAARGLLQWQKGVEPGILEGADKFDFNFGVLGGIEFDGRRIFAVDVDSRVEVGEDHDAGGLSDAEFTATGLEICSAVKEAVEEATGYAEWCRQTLEGRAAFLLSVPPGVDLATLKTIHLYRKGLEAEDLYVGKVEFITKGQQLAACGTYARTGERIVWHRRSGEGETFEEEQTAFPKLKHLGEIESDLELRNLVAGVRKELKAAGFICSPKQPKKAQKAKSVAGGGGHTPKGMRSEAAYDRAMEVCGDGADRAAMCAALADCEDHGIRDWYFEKGEMDGREVVRLWEKGRALRIAREVIEAGRVTDDRATMLRDATALWQRDADAFRWYHDRGKNEEAILLFEWALYLYGRMPVQDEFPALEGPKVNPRTGEVLPAGHSMGIELEQVRTLDDVIDFFNQRYAVATEQGKTFVLGAEPDPDPKIARSIITRSSFEDLRNRYLGHSIEVPDDGTGEPVRKKIASVWLSSPRQKAFDHVVFHPGQPRKPRILNLWNGFAVKPVPGDWTLMRNHIRDVICSGNAEHFDYLMKWTARLVQFPADQGEVAVVLRGGEGTGKGFWARALLSLCGKHGMSIQNSNHLVGNFNAHLRDCIFLFADEAFFAGDKGNVGVLKSLVTEPSITIEAKHRNAITAPNFLHIVMASNEDWVVPASADARRFFVMDVGDARKNDHPYYAAITTQMNVGGYEAMMHDLLAIDLKGFNHRNVPKTEALSAQREHSFNSFQRFLRDFLGPQAAEGEWKPWHPTKDLYGLYLQTASQTLDRRPMGQTEFGRRLGGMGYDDKRGYVESVLGGIGKERTRGFVFGDLETARRKFERATGTQPRWECVEEVA